MSDFVMPSPEGHLLPKEPENTPAAKCPHPAGSTNAIQWWRDEWAAAVERGDVEPRAEDAVPQKLPAFPVEVLPEPMRTLVKTVAANKRVPVDMPALLALTCVAIFAAPRLTIYRGRDWWEPLAEWTLTVAESGEGKSPAVSVFADMIRSVQRWINELHAARIAEQVAGLEETVAAKTKPKDGMTKAEQDRCAAEVKALVEQIAQLEETKPQQLLIGGSTTLEAIERAMAANGGTIAILDDEGGAFGIVSGVYNNGVPTGLDTILKGYSGTWVPANERITRAAESIPRAILCYGITVQPTVLSESFRSPALRARGFHARWCYAIPEPLVGSRPVDPPDLDHQAVDQFTDTLRLIAALPSIDSESPRRTWPYLELSPEARKLHMEMQEAFEPRLDVYTGDLGTMLDWANKYPGRILRHAGLLHLAAGLGLGDAVSEETMLAAITVGEWALSHAADVYRRAPRPKTKGGREADDAASMVGLHKVLMWITKTKTIQFTARDAHVAVRKQSWCAGADDVQEVLVALHRDGLLRSVARQGSDGRELAAAPWWVAHPDLVYGA